MRLVALLTIPLALACSKAPAPAPSPAVDAEAVFGPLEVGADYAATFTKVNKEPFMSSDHGGRWVNTFVNDVGKDAFFAEGGTFPVGSVVVKESFEDDNGKPGAERGPIFVMEKRAPGYDSARADWWYAMHWEKPVGRFAKQLGGPVYWRGKSKKANYCFSCHKKYADHDQVAVGIPESNLIGGTQVEEAAGVEEVDVDF